MADLADTDWFDPDVLPSWSDIHEGVLTEARKTAARIHEHVTSDERIAVSSEGRPIIGGEAVATTDFMRKVGFDPRYIVLLTQWIDEQRSVVSQLMNLYIAEIQSSCEALDAATNEEIEFDG
ncbi:MAG: hypothetical protein EB141_17800 [Verrucomicrobia bacterium]|nr:hypothetical protein [Pseudomonadota bacterium]NDA68648.1 hypothetical protein [Verrucomicrobiota bacterium]NDB77466.1 hypothetical protein [Verrucomicrobiota bacterium]NDD40464.1 hypothetical protein [Verrucomicrobiota bacterium]NDF00571.1 hypothetical protein [Verrucomicrobiota bacterium]